jgi:hypothetical protein
VGDVEVITQALAAGATALLAGTGAGAEGIARQAVQDAYAQLKNLLRGRLAGRDGALRELDAETTRQADWHDRIGGDLRDTLDEQVIAAAHELLKLAGLQPATNHNLNTGTSHGLIGNNEIKGQVNFYYGHPPVPATD